MFLVCIIWLGLEHEYTRIWTYHFYGNRKRNRAIDFC